jgi:hypothetical protein
MVLEFREFCTLLVNFLKCYADLRICNEPRSIQKNTSVEEQFQRIIIGEVVFNRWIILLRRRYQRVPAAAQDGPDGGGRQRTQQPGGRTLSAGS